MIELPNGMKIKVIKNKLRIISQNPPINMDIDISETGRVSFSGNGIPIASAANLEELVDRVKPIIEKVKHEHESKNGLVTSVKSFFGF